VGQEYNSLLEMELGTIPTAPHLEKHFTLEKDAYLTVRSRCRYRTCPYKCVLSTHENLFRSSVTLVISINITGCLMKAVSTTNPGTLSI